MHLKQSMSSFLLWHLQSRRTVFLDLQHYNQIKPTPEYLHCHSNHVSKSPSFILFGERKSRRTILITSHIGFIKLSHSSRHREKESEKSRASLLQLETMVQLKLKQQCEILKSPRFIPQITKTLRYSLTDRIF